MQKEDGLLEVEGDRLLLELRALSFLAVTRFEDRWENNPTLKVTDIAQLAEELLDDAYSLRAFLCDFEVAARVGSAIVILNNERKEGFLGRTFHGWAFSNTFRQLKGVLELSQASRRTVSTSHLQREAIELKVREHILQIKPSLVNLLNEPAAAQANTLVLFASQLCVEAAKLAELERNDIDQSKFLCASYILGAIYPADPLLQKASLQIMDILDDLIQRFDLNVQFPYIFKKEDEPDSHNL